MNDDPRRMDEIRAKLGAVLDPELDEPITELGFVDALEAGDGGRVSIRLRLPTYWCAANFAFMIAADARDRVAELDWVKELSVEIAGHYCGDEISGGVSAGRSFASTFAGEPAGELDELRAIFRTKAFLRRQERLIRHLLGCGYGQAELVAMTVGELEAISLPDAEGARLRSLYLEARRARRDTAGGGEPALVRSDGRALRVEEFAGYLGELRRVRINMDFNGEFCRGLLRARKENTAHTAVSKS